MRKLMNQFVRRLKRSAPAIQGAAIAALGLLLLAILEVYSAWAAFANAPSADLWPTPWGDYPRAALIHSAMSVVCGVLAFAGSAIAGALKDDARREISGRAWQARAAALALLTVPVGYLAAAFAADREAKSWETYHGSDAYEADKALTQDYDADSRARLEAAERLKPPGASEPQANDWLQAIFLHALVMWSASAFRLPQPLTQAQRNAIEREDRMAAIRAKAEATRLANAKARMKAERRNGWLTPVFN